VQQDFSSPEKAGFRCITEVPCGEPTGFTGQCTKQPEVGGAWPCITAIPLCAAEPTGFTGKCTDLPWPNPTRYLGCTYLHCPTKDLTHIPHICHIVASGVPGCAVGDPRGGGIDPAAKASAAEEGKEGGGAADRAAAPSTSIPGCGYTQTWGLCETQLLGCGWTQQWGLCQQTQPPKCNVSVDIPCITQTETPQCRGGVAAFRAVAPGPVIPIDTQFLPCNVSVAGACPSAVDACPTEKGCQTQPPTALCTQVAEACPTRFPPVCPPTVLFDTCPLTSCGPKCQTQQHECTVIPPCTQVGPQCPTGHFECTQFGPQCPSGGPICPTSPPPCPGTNVLCPMTTPELACARAQAFAAAGPVGPVGPTGYYGCTQFGPQCFTYPNGDCTFFGCPTDAQGRAAGPGVGCTQSGPQCPTHAQPYCTCAGPGCPPTPATVCTQSGPQCPSQFGSGCPTDLQFDCTFGCTQVGTGCPMTTLELSCARAQAFGVAGPIGSTAVFACTQQCPPPPSAGAVCPTPFHGCPPPPQTGPLLHCTPACTVFGPGCPPPVFGTAAGPQCQQAGGAAQITPLTVPVWQCQLPTPVTRCFICPPHHRTWLPWQCPLPSPWCPPITQLFICGGGPSAVDACPTRLCGGGQQFF